MQSLTEKAVSLPDAGTLQTALPATNTDPRVIARALKAQRMADALDRLRRDCASDPALHRLSDLTVHRVYSGRVVATAMRDDARVFVKQWTGPAGGLLARTTAEAIRVMSARMGSGRSGVAACLDLCVPCGIIVLAEAPGTALDDLTQGDPAQDNRPDHARAVRLAARWQVHNIAGQAEAHLFHAAAFVANVQTILADIARKRGPTPADTTLVAAMTDQLERRASALDQQPMTVGFAHGDFHPRNLHATDDDTVTAFDVESIIKRPPVLEMAKFLVVLSLAKPSRGTTHTPQPFAATLPDPIRDAIVDAGGIPADEVRDLLPLFTGSEILRRLLVDTGRREAHLHDMLGAWLAAT